MPDHDPLGARASRRSLLAGVIGTLVLGAGCARTPGQPQRSTITAPTLTNESPFYVAHRGGGDNWPEMTAYAYEQATRIPTVRALEISVCLSADGILVCSHDPSTERLTGVPYTIANESWETLSSLMVSARETDDPTQPARPLTRFDDVASRYMDDFVLFVEPKVPEAVDVLMKKMVSLNQPERVVWKQPINQPHFEEAKRAGFLTWGYVLNEIGHLGQNLQDYAASPNIDLLGAQRSQRDSFISNVSTAAFRYGKSTLIWPIRNVGDRARGLRLGCEGMMTSNIVDISDHPL